jgi:hypothetical protein
MAVFMDLNQYLSNNGVFSVATRLPLNYHTVKSLQPPTQLVPPETIPNVWAVFQATVTLERAPMFLSIMSIHMESEQTFPTELFHKVEPTPGFEPRLPLINALCYGVLTVKAKRVRALIFVIAFFTVTPDGHFTLLVF